MSTAVFFTGGFPVERWMKGKLPMDLEQQIVQWLSMFAYRPMELYCVVVLLMLASGFGLPFPEEIVLVSSGLIAYTGTRPDLYPPPYAGATPVDPYILATVCFTAVFMSDYLVYAIGRYFGKSLIKKGRFAKWLDPEQSPRLHNISKNYGTWACGIFRFTPGIRFPGHLSCGIMGISPVKFIAIDGTAALLTVPTQVIFVGLYGDAMLGVLKQFKIVLFSVLGVLAVLYAGYRIYKYIKARRADPSATTRPQLSLVHSVSGNTGADKVQSPIAAINRKAG